MAREHGGAVDPVAWSGACRLDHKLYHKLRTISLFINYV